MQEDPRGAASHSQRRQISEREGVLVLALQQLVEDEVGAPCGVLGRLLPVGDEVLLQHRHRHLVQAASYCTSYQSTNYKVQVVSDEME